MSFVIVDPQAVDDTANEVDGLANLLDDTSTDAASMTALAPAAADRVSTVAAKRLSRQAQNFEELSTQYAAILRQYANVLRNAGAAYSAAEADNIENVENIV
ncbi:PE-PGRS family protein [Mycobacterium haemophilum DSM 44634]|nr:PE family protein [Mycobacterium haemophilum]